MTVLKVLHYPNNSLRQVSYPVKKIDSDIQRVINDMVETMYFENGIGLAAPQVNIHQQIIVINISNKKKETLVLVNPKIIDKNEYIISEEGCLSIPKQYGSVRRYKNIKINFLNRKSEYLQLDATDLLSVCIQHEIDHLKGKLFIDHLSLLKQDMIKKKMKKLHRLKKIERAENK